MEIGMLSDVGFAVLKTGFIRLVFGLMSRGMYTWPRDIII